MADFEMTFDGAKSKPAGQEWSRVLKGKKSFVIAPELGNVVPRDEPYVVRLIWRE